MGSASRFRPIVFVLSSILVFSSAVAEAQSDTCTEAPLVGEGSFEGSTDGATSDGAAGCGSSGSSPDEWFRFQAPAAGTLAASTCGSSYDTVLSIHSSCPGDGGSEIECNDDACGLQSIVQTPVEAGQEYWIRVSGFNRANGAYTLELDFTEEVAGDAGDTCATALEVGEGLFEGATTGASSDGSAGCGASGSSPDQWYRFTAPAAGLLVATTCGSSYDTVLSIHESCPGSSGNQLVCNDDACGLQSTVSWEVAEGESVLVRVAGFSGASGDYVLELALEDPPEPGDGADITVTATAGISQWARLGSRVALSMSSTLCNIGDEPIDWYANPDPRHPFLVFNAFREKDGRMVQIGQSWVKHGFAASQTSGLCGLPCVRDPSGNLGPGCADIYGAGTNASQRTFGPRTEINPWTGAFTYAGSHMATTGSDHSPIDHRLVVDDGDLDPDANDGATYYSELYTVCHDDVEHTNSVGWQRFAVTGGSPGGSWSLTFVDTLSTVGCALDDWEGATRTTVPEAPVDDGRCWVYAKVTDNGDGTWRYEYAVYNLDLDAAVRAFSVPVASTSTVTNAGFHAVRSDGTGYSNDPWEHVREADRVVWSTGTSADPGGANPLLWGTAYNFWFDIDAAPVASTVTLATFDTSVLSEVSGLTMGPSTESVEPPGFRRGDADGSGVVEMTDAIVVLEYLFGGAGDLTCPDAADSNDDDLVDVSDAVFGLLWLFSGGDAPPAPGPSDCGQDPTTSGLPSCAYDPDNC